MIRPVLVLLFAAMVVAGATSIAQETAMTPDIIFVNGDIYTQGTPARARALAVREGRVVAVGGNDEIRKLKGAQTKVVDLGGHFVMPGFNDAHVHLASGGFEKLNVNLIGVKTVHEMQERVALKVKRSADGEWLVGRGWDHTMWPGQALPTAQDLDAVTAGHPAIFVRVDGHIAIANSAALKAAGVTGSTKAPEGGKIDLDAKGQPTGILRESAQELVFAKVPAPTKEKRREAAELALADAARWGITSAQDNSSWDDFLVYEDLERDGKLTLRIAEWLNFANSVDELKQHRAQHDHSDPMLHTTMLKGYMDGSLGSGTAALLAPYAHDAKNSGLPQYEQATLNKMAIERVDAGFQLGFHAIGDRAAQMALDAFGVAEASPQARPAAGATSAKDFRFRIEHDQVIAPSQFAQYKKLGVIASVQPCHLLTDMNWAEDRIGPQRAETSYPWKQFLDNGVPLAFGTDYPVEPINPFRNVYAAVTRKNEAGTKEYYPAQKLTIEQALAAYTKGSAFAEFAEKNKGTLAAGMVADFVVLDRDLTKVAAPEILKTRVLRTVVGGRTVFEVP
jgi:predicted amidohydrolase YtcJ